MMNEVARLSTNPYLRYLLPFGVELWMESSQSCGLAMLHKLAGVNPAREIASHEPGIEPCRHIGSDVLDA